MIRLLLSLFTAFFSLAQGRSCAEGFSEHCSVCTQWEQIKPGDFFCSQYPNSTTSATNVCQMATADGKVCLDEKIFKKREMACTKIHVITPEDTCDIIARKYDLDLRKLNEINGANVCDKLHTREHLCVGAVNDCPTVKTPKGGQTCYEFMKENKLSNYAMRLLNQNIYCDRNESSTATMAPYPLCTSDPCTKRHTIVDYTETCDDIEDLYLISREQLLLNNEDFSCDDLQIGRSVCVWRIGQNVPIDKEKHCAMSAPIDPNHSCEDMATRYALSFSHFMDNNRFLLCDELADMESICVGDGYFSEGRCTDYVITTQLANSCEVLQRRFFESKEEMMKLNALLQCSNLQLGMLVCMRAAEKPDLMRLVRELKTRSARLENAYQLHTEEESTESEARIFKEMIVDIANIAVTVRLEKTYAENSNIRRVVNALTQHIDREKACASFRKSVLFGTKYSHIGDCICDEKQLLISCGAILFEELETLQRSKTIYEATDVPAFATPDCFLGASYDDKTKGGCTVPGCKVEYRIFSLHFDTKMCWPPQNAAVNKSLPCDFDECFEKQAKEIDVRLCSHDLRLKFSFGGLPCLPFKGLYHPLLGVLRLQTVAFNHFFKSDARLSFKVNPMHSSMIEERDCTKTAYRCQDYCIWRDQPSWHYHGHLSTSLDFGHWKLPIIDLLVTFPYDKCFGNKAVVVFENEQRTNAIKVRCWSSDYEDEYFTDEQTIEYRQRHEFAFKVYETTLVTCSLKDGVVEDIAIDVYGGTDAPVGRKFHVYAIMSTEIVYYPADYPSQRRTVAIWD